MSSLRPFRKRSATSARCWFAARRSGREPGRVPQPDDQKIPQAVCQCEWGKDDYSLNDRQPARAALSRTNRSDESGRGASGQWRTAALARRTTLFDEEVASERAHVRRHQPAAFASQPQADRCESSPTLLTASSCAKSGDRGRRAGRDSRRTIPSVEDFERDFPRSASRWRPASARRGSWARSSPISI